MLDFVERKVIRLLEKKNLEKTVTKHTASTYVENHYFSRSIWIIILDFSSNNGKYAFSTFNYEKPITSQATISLEYLQMPSNLKYFICTTIELEALEVVEMDKDGERVRRSERAWKRNLRNVSNFLMK